MSNEPENLDEPLTLFEALLLCMVYCASAGVAVGFAYGVAGWFF